MFAPAAVATSASAFVGFVAIAGFFSLLPRAEDWSLDPKDPLAEVLVSYAGDSMHLLVAILIAAAIWQVAVFAVEPFIFAAYVEAGREREAKLWTLKTNLVLTAIIALSLCVV